MKPIYLSLWKPAASWRVLLACSLAAYHREWQSTGEVGVSLDKRVHRAVLVSHFQRVLFVEPRKVGTPLQLLREPLL
jgi:hypothetical protein